MTERSHRFLQQAMQTTKHDCTNRWNVVKLNKICNFTLKTIFLKTQKNMTIKKNKKQWKNEKNPSNMIKYLKNNEKKK